MRWMRMGWVAAVALAFGLAVGTAQAAVWNVVQNGDCTGVGDATVAAQATNTAFCCTGVGQGFCNTRMNFGQFFEYFVTFVATGSYAPGGDILTATQLAKVGMSTWVRLDCENPTTGTDPPGTDGTFNVVVRRTSAASPFFTIAQYVDSTGVEQAVASIAGRTMTCLAWGY